jgi:hypothetical protein
METVVVIEISRVSGLHLSVSANPNTPNTNVHVHDGQGIDAVVRAPMLKFRGKPYANRLFGTAQTSIVRLYSCGGQDCGDDSKAPSVDLLCGHVARRGACPT